MFAMLVEAAITIIYQCIPQSMDKGVAAYFTAINEQWGLKFYDNPRSRDYNHQTQLRLHNMGLAPDVGPTFSAFCPKFRCNVYGFLTEIAEVWTSNCSELHGKLDKLVSGYNDICENNCGEIDGVPVVIDVGGISFTDVRGRSPWCDSWGVEEDRLSEIEENGNCTVEF